MRKHILVLLMLLLPCVLMAQIKGVVLDESGEPIIGASVVVVGTNQGTITDFDGQFVIENAPSNATIEVTYLGYLPQQLSATASMTITLREDVQSLEDVVVVGYGAAKIKDLTSPIELVKGDALVSIPSSNPMAALQGKVSGVNIVNSGVPGAGPTVQIRGIGSFSNNTPLYVVDGMFYDNINFLNNSDIEEMSIMKDASAAAIYGVRAANGVVIITT